MKRVAGVELNSAPTAGDKKGEPSENPGPLDWKLWNRKSVQADVRRFEDDPRFTREPAVGFEPTTC
jgi:hypothetical protein